MEEILPRLHRIVVPLPGNPLREINSYVFTADDRSLVIDTGMNRPECWEVLAPGLAELGVDAAKTDFVITHLHADHQGMVPGLLKEGSRAFMGESDAATLMSGNTPHAGTTPMGDFAAKNGFPAAELERAIGSHPGVKFGPGAVVNYMSIREGDVFKVGDYTLEAFATPGHSEGHMVFYLRDQKILLSGDHVLGDITPNIQCWWEGLDPLANYIDSLHRVLDLDVALCLPGHRSLIRDFRGRVLELIEHHRNRANEALSIIRDEPLTAYWTASKMTWDIRAKDWDDFPPSQKWFAVGETISHLVYLENKGFIRREDRDDVAVYVSTGRDGML